MATWLRDKNKSPFWSNTCCLQHLQLLKPQKIILQCYYIQIEIIFFRNLIPKLDVTPPDTETLRIFVTLPMLSLFENPKLFSELHSPFSRNLISLTKPAWSVVEKWISVQTAEYLKPYVYNFKVRVLIFYNSCRKGGKVSIWLII